MKNNSHVINTIVEKIEERGCYDNPGPAARKAGEFIDEGYIVIPRSYLPQPRLDHDGDAYLGNVTEYAMGGNTTTMRRRAYDYLAMAEFLDDRREKEREEKDAKKLNEDRYRAFKILYPNSETPLENFIYENCMYATKNAITHILDLESQLAK